MKKIDGCATLFFVEFVDAEMNGGMRLSSIDAYRSAKQNIFFGSGATVSAIVSSRKGDQNEKVTISRAQELLETSREREGSKKALVSEVQGSPSKYQDRRAFDLETFSSGKHLEKL